MGYDSIDDIIKDITEIAQLSPEFCIEDPATRDFAEQIFKDLNKLGANFDPDVVYSSLLDHEWEEKQAKQFLKVFKKYFKKS